MVFKICFLCIGVVYKFIYYVVVVEVCFCCDGFFVEFFGIYILQFKSQFLIFDVVCVEYWLSKGVIVIDIVCGFINKVKKVVFVV